MNKNTKIILPGGAGLVGQNLVVILKEAGYSNIVVLDKHAANLKIMQSMHGDITAEYADFSEQDAWENHFAQADMVVMLQAQIGDVSEESFIRNNVTATKNILATMKHHSVPKLIHISSSVVNSVTPDYYSASKRAQEELVKAEWPSAVILRPTLMFGWFDRKHLGWLARFMKKTPVFPVPGHGRYSRQPLYARDFCRILLACMEQDFSGKIFNITGQERIDYRDIIHAVKKAVGARCMIIYIPYSVFYFLLKLWAAISPKPAFTAGQLKSLVAGDEFEVIDWPGIFGVTSTPFVRATEETFRAGVYSHVALEF